MAYGKGLCPLHAPARCARCTEELTKQQPRARYSAYSYLSEALSVLSPTKSLSNGWKVASLPCSARAGQRGCKASARGGLLPKHLAAAVACARLERDRVLICWVHGRHRAARSWAQDSRLAEVTPVAGHPRGCCAIASQVLGSSHASQSRAGARAYARRIGTFSTEHF